MHPDEAGEAVNRGVDEIIVSNHGGRQLDGAVASIRALPGIVDAIDGTPPVMIDGGFRRGVDVIKALALGARAVLIGRPHLWGVACGGEEGVLWVLDCFAARSIARSPLGAGTASAKLDPSIFFRAGSDDGEYARLAPQRSNGRRVRGGDCASRAKTRSGNLHSLSFSKGRVLTANMPVVRLVNARGLCVLQMVLIPVSGSSKSASRDAPVWLTDHRWIERTRSGKGNGHASVEKSC